MVLRLWLLLALVGCIPRTIPPVVSEHDRTIMVATVILDSDGRRLETAEDALLEAIEEQLSSRNLNHTPISEHIDGELEALRLSQHRLAWLARQQEGADLILVVDAQADFFAHMNERYRWVVRAEISIADPSNLDHALTHQVEIPVFLQYHHLRETDALDAATPTLMREFSTMLEAWISVPE